MQLFFFFGVLIGLLLFYFKDDGCMTLDEYKDFSAGTPEIASKIYMHFDPNNTNCLTVDKVASQFQVMDTDGMAI